MYLDFRAIKAAVSIEQAAEKLKLTLKKSGSQLRGKCPACSDGDERSLAITPARGLWYCFSGNIGGDQLGLVQHITGLELKEAAAYLSPHTREEPTAPPAPRQEAKATKTGDFVGSSPKPTKEFDAEAFASKLT